MKKLLPVLLIVIVAGLIIWKVTAAPSGDVQTSGPGSESSSAEQALSREAQNIPRPDMGATGPMSSMNEAGEDDEDIVDQDERPAAQVYKTAEDALKAVKEGAVDYNDVVLEQFTLPGDDCTWCPEFYKSLREMAVSADSTDDQKSYFAEILAISGRVENVAALIEAIKSAGGDETKADLYTEGLELTLGKSDVITYLGEQLGTTDNESLKESMIAALTNQGTKQAAELLYQQTVKAGDPDGFYKSAIGLGEFVPDDETIPYLQEMAMKRDQYSHLAVKAMLNSGLSGLRSVFDLLASSKDTESDRQGLLKDAIDHISYDEETEAFLKKEVESPRNKLSAEFASSILADFSKTEQEIDSEQLDLEMPMDEGEAVQ